jgi:hypothetical protein
MGGQDEKNHFYFGIIPAFNRIPGVTPHWRSTIGGGRLLQTAPVLSRKLVQERAKLREM